MKLQLGIKLFHHFKMSPTSFKVIWLVLIIDEAVIVLITGQLNFTADELKQVAIISFGSFSTDILWSFNGYQVQGRCENFSFSNQNEDILSGTHVNDRSTILRYLFLYMLPFYSLYRFQFFELVRPQGWLQFWVVIPFPSTLSLLYVQH